MGRPFDFGKLQSRSDLPGTYDPTRFLTVASVANTLYSLFGVSPEHYRVLLRRGPQARVLEKLLA